MKKALCLLLVIIMLVGLYGCFGESNPENVRGEIVNGNQNQNVNQNTNEPEFSLGKSTGNTYNNDFLGISCTLPSDWVFYTDEQILALNNMTGEYIDDDTIEALKNATVVYDMYAATPTNDKSINVNLEKLTAAQLLVLDIKQSLEAQIDSVESGYKSMGYTDVDVRYEKIAVDGKEFDALVLTAKIQGYDFYAKTFSFRRGNYLASVSVGSLATDQTPDILGYITVK